MHTRIFKWVTKWMQILWARHNVRIYNQMISEEIAYHEAYDKRMRQLYRQRADELAVLNRLERNTSGLDWGLAGKWDTQSKIRQGN